MSCLIETHFHPALEDNVLGELEVARADGVCAFVAVGADLASSQAVTGFAENTKDVWATVGCHPHAASEFNGDLDFYRQLAGQTKTCAIGEIGLDYYYGYSDKESQKRVFRQFLGLAAELRLPAVIHCREAYDDCLDIMKNALEPGQPFEVHSFTGPVEVVDKFVEMGAYVSFNGIVTFKKADNVRMALDAVPLNRLLLETDAPYLAPAPHRGHRNQPAYLSHIAKFVAARKEISYPEIAELTSTNARNFFKALKRPLNAL